MVISSSKSRMAGILVMLLILFAVNVTVHASVINPAKADRLIWCGDSRTVQMGTRIYGYEREEDGKTVIARHMIAKAGSTVSWASTVGYAELKKRLKKKSYRNAILILNWGVNQIDKEENSAENYLALIEKIHNEFPRVKIYVMSVNPVKYDPDSRHVYTKKLAAMRTKLIKQFNRYVQENLPDGVKYIDTYHHINFSVRDGIHYTGRTYRNIVKYVIGTTDLQ